MAKHPSYVALKCLAWGVLVVVLDATLFFGVMRFMRASYDHGVLEVIAAAPLFPGLAIASAWYGQWQALHFSPGGVVILVTNVLFWGAIIFVIRFWRQLRAVKQVSGQDA